jgi:phosphoserine phosphatase
MKPNRVNCVIVDFDGTLSFDRYFEPLGMPSLDTISHLVFADNSSRWADPWMKGDLSSQDIALYLSQYLPNSKEEILAALHLGCANMNLNPIVLGFSLQQREVGRKTALVTANMDVFTEIVVPSHGLDAQFDLILNTSDHRTLDKSILWRKALSAFGPEFSFATSVLIDDSPRMISLFQSLGGHAYRYKNEYAFKAWLQETGFTKQFQNNRMQSTSYLGG